MRLSLIIFLLPFQNAQAQWTVTNGPPGAYITDLERDATGNLYLLTDKGTLHKSTDNAGSWSKVTIVSPVAGLSFTDIFFSGSTLYGLALSAIWTSTDGGANWSSHTADDKRPPYVYRTMKYGPDNFLLAWGDYGIWLSKDDGANWVQIFTDQISAQFSYQHKVAANSNGDVFVVSATQGILRYQYPGLAGVYDPQAWSVRIAASNTWNTTIVVDSNNKIYTAGNFNNSPDIKASADGGGVFTSVKNNITDTDFGGILYTSGSTVYFSNNVYNINSKVYFSTNGGATWSTPTGPQAIYNSPITSIAVRNATEFYVGTEGAGIFKTTNSGTLFSIASIGLATPDGNNIEVSNTGRWLQTNSYSQKGYWTSVDNGVNWAFTSASVYIRRFKKFSNQYILGYGGDASIVRSTDDGLTFPSTYSYDLRSVVEGPSSTLYGLVSGGNQIASSTTWGATWTNINPTGLPGSYSFLSDYIGIDGSSNIYILLTNNGNSKKELYKISAGVATLLAAPFAADFNPTGLFVLNSKLYVGSDKAIYVSADAGATWSTINLGGWRVWPITQGAYSGIATSNWETFSVTQDEGKSWNSSRLPTPSTWVTDFRVDGSGTIVAAVMRGATLRNTSPLLVDPVTLPPYIDFNWQPTNGPYGTFTTKLFKDNSANVYSFSRTDQPFYKTTNAASWTKISYNLDNFHAASVNESNGHLFGYNNNNLFKSTTGGASWTSINTEAMGTKDHLSIAPNGDIVLFDGGGDQSNPAKLYVSINGGVSFGSPKFTWHGWITGGFFVDSHGYYYLQFWDTDVNQDRFVFSTNRGATWSSGSAPAQYFGAMGADTNGNIYLTYYEHVYRSADQGANWTSIAGDIGSFYTLGDARRIWFSPAGDIFFFGGALDPTGKNGLFRSVNAGVNWTFAAFPLSISNVADITWVGTKMVLATEDGIYTSNDNGATLTFSSTGIVDFAGRFELASQSKLLVTNNERTNESTDVVTNFQNWSQRRPSLEGFLHKPDGTKLGWDNHYLYQTNDGGVSWTPISKLPTDYFVQYFATNGTNYYYATLNYNIGKYEIYRSDDLVAWTLFQPLQLPVLSEARSISVDAANRLYITLWNQTKSKREAYQVRGGRAYLIPGTNWVENVLLHKNKIYLYDGGAGVIFTTTDGTIWNQISAPTGYNLIINDYKDYFFVTYGDGGLWLSRNQGQAWQDVGLGSSVQRNYVQDVVVNEYNGYAYATVDNSPIRKSNGIIIPPELVIPSVVSLSPANLATGTSIKPQIKITFDEAVTAVAGKLIVVYDGAQNIVFPMDAKNGVQEGKSFTYTLPSTLQFNKLYSMTVDAGAFEDIFHNPSSEILDGDWKFTTKPTPTIMTLSPAKNATNVSPDTKLVVTFSETMTPVASKNLNVYDASQANTPVATIPKAKSIYSTANDYVVFDPAYPTPDEPVTLYFNAAVGGKELMGLPLDQDVYLHTGVIIDGTFPDGGPQGSLWTNVLFDWGTQDPKGKLTRVPGETDKWRITFTSLRNYFGLAPNVNIYRLCVIFRNGAGNLAASVPLTVPGGQVGGNYDYQSGDLFMNLNYSGTGSTAIPSTTFEYTLPTPLALQKNYIAKLDAGAYKTAEGVSVSLLINNSDWTFSTRNPPTVSILSPASGASSVSPNPSLAITFSEALAPKAGKNLYLYKSTNLTTAYRTIDVTTAVVNGAVVTFGLTSPLDFQTQYIAKLDPGAFTTSDGGAVNLLTNNTDWIFTVRNLPTVASTAPVNAGTVSSLSPSLAITWTENTTAAIGKKMYITDQANVSSPLYTIDVSSASIAAATSTFSLPGPLNYGATYSVTFDANAFVTIDGGWLSAFTSSGWTFTARNKPAVSSLLPAHQATAVATKPTVTINFAEAVSTVPGKNLYITEVGKTTPVITTLLSGATINGNSLSITITTALNYLTQYFITTDPGSFKTSDNVPFSLFTNSTDWLFTSAETPDIEPPAIVYTPATFIKGGANKIQPTITDNKSVGSSTVYYRSITSTGNFTPANLTLNTSTNKWEVAVEDAWLDNMGLNYYIVARDASNNKARLPKDSTVFISNLSFTTAPSVPSTVLSFGGQVGNYRIISIPYILTDNKVSSVFNELGPADDTKWRLLTYSKGRGASTEWKEYPASLTTIDRGRGYWINIVSSTTLQIDGATTPSNDRSNLFSMTLNPGYNQIGNPYTQEISWADIRKQNANIHNLQTFNGSFAEGDVLKPFEGGFVFVDGTIPITINFNFKGARTNGHVFDRGSPDLANTNWYLPLSLQQGEMTNRISGVGMNEDATNTFDAFDDVHAPSIVDYPKATFVDPAFEMGGYPISIVSSRDSYMWSVEIATATNEQILLQWDNSTLGENAKDLIWWDVTAQKATSMRSINSYAIDPAKGRKFKIYYGTDVEKSIVPEKISLGNPFPNPASGFVQIPFTIPSGLNNCRARVEVFDAMGRRTSILTDSIYEPGIHQLVWDVGTATMSNGLYTIRLSVSGDSIQDHTATKVVVSR